MAEKKKQRTEREQEVLLGLIQLFLMTGNPVGKPRLDGQDRPLNTDFDLFSRGVNGLSSEKITNPHSIDDIVRGRNGGFFGVAKKYTVGTGGG